MKMQATVRAAVVIEFDADVPELELEEQERPGGRNVHVASNEAKVLAARAAAAKKAEKLAKDAFKGFKVVEVVVTEVTEA